MHAYMHSNMHFVMYWLRLLHIANTPRSSHLLPIMSSDPIKFAYVCLTRKPWGLTSNRLYFVDTQVTMLLYRGSFELADLAEKVVPLARGEPVAFPPGTLDRHGLAWQGWAVRCLCCLSFVHVLQVAVLFECRACFTSCKQTVKYATRQANLQRWGSLKSLTWAILASPARQTIHI